MMPRAALHRSRRPRGGASSRSGGVEIPVRMPLRAVERRPGVLHSGSAGASPTGMARIAAGKACSAECPVPRSPTIPLGAGESRARETQAVY